MTSAHSLRIDSIRISAAIQNNPIHMGSAEMALTECRGHQWNMLHASLVSIGAVLNTVTRVRGEDDEDEEFSFWAMCFVDQYSKAHLVKIDANLTVCELLKYQTFADCVTELDGLDEESMMANNKELKRWARTCTTLPFIPKI